MDSREIVDEVDQDKVEECDVSAEEEHRDDDHERRVSQLLITPNPLFLRFPRPRTFLQLGSDFAEEVFRFREHGVGTLSS